AVPCALFFFQAEDGIRDSSVTGVQTCALPILRACLASVTRHAPPGTEVLVVDDASPGGAASAAAGDFPGVRALRLPARGGFCAAANAGIRAAAGEVVELLNDDAEATPGWAAAALARFADPAVAAVAPLVLRWPGGGP